MSLETPLIRAAIEAAAANNAQREAQQKLKNALKEYEAAVEEEALTRAEKNEKMEKYHHLAKLLLLQHLYPDPTKELDLEKLPE